MATIMVGFIWPRCSYYISIVAAVTMKFESAVVTVNEGDCFVNVTIEKTGETLVESIVLVRTVEAGPAVGKPLDKLNYNIYRETLTRFLIWQFGNFSEVCQNIYNPPNISKH